MTDVDEDQRGQLEIWSDVACPWCYMGRRNLQIALDDIDEVDRPAIRWRAFQLDPSLPEGGVDRDAYFAAKFPEPGMIEDAQERLTLLGEDVGIQYRFDRQRTIANTHLAHRFIAAARRSGLDDPVVEALFVANFERGIDIGNADALEQVVAEALGDAAVAASIRAAAEQDDELRLSVDEDIALARELEITGVPCFVADRRIAVPGAVPPNVLAQLIERASTDRRDAQDRADDAG